MTDTTDTTAAAEAAPMIVIFPRGQLSAEDKALFHENGILVAEAEDPKAVMQLQLTRAAFLPLHSALIDGDAIVMSALEALASEKPFAGNDDRITSTGRACYLFVKRLHERAKAAQLKGAP